MADTLTILTADDPPVSLTPSRIVLAANSKVFADMLSLPSSGTNDQPITMAEKKADFEPFLRALAGEEVSLQPVQWETFARLGDKYDAFVVKHVMEKRIWELEAKQIEHLHSFTLATIVGNKELLERTALRALRVKDRKSARFDATQRWKDRLELYNAARTAVFFGFLQTMARAMTTHRHTPAHCYMVSACTRQTAAAIQFVAKIVVDFDSASTELSFKARWEAQGWKETCAAKACSDLCTALDAEWRAKSPSFASVCCHPTETKDVVEPFLKVLEGKDVGELEDQTWEELARVGDKYDSFVVQILIEKRIWMLEAQDDKPLHSYTLASIVVKDLNLLERTAYRALAVKDRSMDQSFGAAQEWKHRLDWWEAMRTCLIVTLLQQVLVEVDRLGTACSCTHAERCTKERVATDTVVATALKSVAIDSDVGNLASRYKVVAPSFIAPTCARTAILSLFQQADTRWEAEMPTFADACRSI